MLTPEAAVFIDKPRMPDKMQEKPVLIRIRPAAYLHKPVTSKHGMC
jgi:hypothetical protein